MLTKFLPVLKLVLRFALILLTAEILLKLVVLLVECAEYAWTDHHQQCRNLLFAVLVGVSDFIDGGLFGKPSVFDTVVNKLKGK